MYLLGRAVLLLFSLRLTHSYNCCFSNFKLSLTCSSLFELVCVLLLLLFLSVMTAWEVAGEYVYTTPGDQDTDYLILTLSVPGYR